MSYDPKKTRDLLQIAGAHESTLGEYVTELASQLRGAEAAINAEKEKTRAAESKAASYAAEAEAAQQTILRMKEQKSPSAVAEKLDAKPKRTRAKKAAATEGVTA